MAADGSPEAPIPAVRVEAAVEPAAVAPAAVVEAAAPAAIVEPAAPALAAPVELVGEKPSLLETTGKQPDKPAAAEVKPEVAAKPDDKPAEKPAVEKPVEPAKEAAKPEGDKPAAEAAPAAPEPLAAIDYSYQLPATLKMDDALRSEAHAAFDAFRADPAKGAQALIDLHAKTMASYAETLRTDTLRDQHKAFNDTRDGWQKDIMADAEFGGSGFQTASKAVARMRDLLVSSAPAGTPEYQQHLKEAEDFYRITGAGDHPVLWRILHNAARFLDEPGLPPQNIRPTASNGRTPGNRRARLYEQPPNKA